MNDLSITIQISYTTLKLLQDGAYIMTENFNKTHPHHGYVQHDKIFTWDKFLDIAIQEQYNKEKTMQDQLSACS